MGTSNFRPDFTTDQNCLAIVRVLQGSDGTLQALIRRSLAVMRHRLVITVAVTWAGLCQRRGDRDLQTLSTHDSGSLHLAASAFGLRPWRTGLGWHAVSGGIRGLPRDKPIFAGTATGSRLGCNQLGCR